MGRPASNATAHKRGGRGSRTASEHPWRKVAWIGIDRDGPQGGHAWMLVLECGHLATRRYVAPAPHRIFRKMPSAPKRCRCLSCALETPRADPQVWIDILTRLGKAP